MSKNKLFMLVNMKKKECEKTAKRGKGVIARCGRYQIIFVI